MRMKKNFFLIIFFILLDQLSKYIVRSSGGFYICNKGIAFGISVPVILIWIIAITLFFYFDYLISTLKSHLFKLGLILILAGGISNLLDRATFGCVIDFIDLKFWPVFNLADTFIVLGVIILLLGLKTDNKNKK